MLKAGPKHEIVRTNSVGRAGVVIAGDREWADLHSGQKHLFAIGG